MSCGHRGTRGVEAILLNVETATWICTMEITPFLKNYHLHDRAMYSEAQISLFAFFFLFVCVWFISFCCSSDFAFTKILLLWSETEEKMGWRWARSAASVRHLSCCWSQFLLTPRYCFASPLETVFLYLKIGSFSLC